MKAWLGARFSWGQQAAPAPAVQMAADTATAPAVPSGLLAVVQRPEVQRVFLALQDNLLVRWQEEQVKLVTVCATAPGEGASTVALGLALAAARDPQEQVLLVDGNLHQPSLAAALGLPAEPGLTDYLTGRIGLDQAIRPSGFANLWLLASGSVSSSHAKLLDPHILHRTLPPLAEHFSLVFIDSPAVSHYPEAPLFAYFSKRILLIIAAGRSRAPVVQYAVSKFPLGVRDRIEVVLNRRTYPIPRFIYDRLWSY